MKCFHLAIVVSLSLRKTSCKLKAGGDIWDIYHRLQAETLKGFHFNKDRNGHLPQEIWDPKPDWMFNFESDSHCARIDVKPFLLPKKLTICFKINHDFTKAFSFMSLLSTRSGESLVDSFKNKTYKQMQQEIIPLLALAYNLGWASVHHTVGNKFKDSTGQLLKVYGWQKWEQRCVGFDYDVGKVVSYIDGAYDGSQVRGNEFFSDALKWANDQLKEKNLITDVLIGCSNGARGTVLGRLLTFKCLIGSSHRKR